MNDIYINTILHECKYFYISNNNNPTNNNLDIYNTIIKNEIKNIYNKININSCIETRQNYIFKILQKIVYTINIDIDIKECFYYINDCLIQLQFIKKLNKKQKQEYQEYNRITQNEKNRSKNK